MRSSRSPSASSSLGSRRPTLRNCTTLAALAALAAFVPTTLAGGQKLTLTLDWTPNPDHVGFYDARYTGLFTRAGLDVTIRAPSDPTAALKLVGVGRSDLAVSYEQELFFAAAKKLPVIAVAAVVPQPLNSFMAIESQVKSLRDLKGRTVGITGVPSDYATLDTALGSVGLTRRNVKVVTVGYNLLTALLSYRVDAVLGVYRNVEGIQLQLRGLHPTIIPVDRAGVPTYDELVLVASKTRLRNDPAYRSAVKRFVAAFLAGTADARSHPSKALVILNKVTASGARFLARATPATLRLLAGRKGVGCLSVRDWQRFGAWMDARGLLKKPIPAASVVDASFLPPRCH
jgi:putative hydroxymethylpyrimidine transport system substrate-binding protein